MIKKNYLSNYNNLKAPNEDILILYFKNGIIETYRKLGWLKIILWARSKIIIRTES